MARRSVHNGGHRGVLPQPDSGVWLVALLAVRCGVVRHTRRGVGRGQDESVGLGHVGPVAGSRYAAVERGGDHLRAGIGAGIGGLSLAAAILSLLVVIGPALWVCRTEPGNRWAELAERSIVFIIAAIFGPVSSKAYLAVLLLPNTLLFAAYRSPQAPAHTARIAGVVIGIAFLLGGLTSPGAIGKTLAGRLEMASVPTVSWLILLGGLLWFRAHATAFVGRNEPPTEDAGGSMRSLLVKMASVGPVAWPFTPLHFFLPAWLTFAVPQDTYPGELLCFDMGEVGPQR